MLGVAFFACLSITLAGLVRNRDRLMGIGQAITMPLFFASNTLYPIDVMLAWAARPEHHQPAEPRGQRVACAADRQPDESAGRRRVAGGRGDRNSHGVNAFASPSRLTAALTDSGCTLAAQDRGTVSSADRDPNVTSSGRLSIVSQPRPTHPAATNESDPPAVFDSGRTDSTASRGR